MNTPPFAIRFACRSSFAPLSLVNVAVSKLSYSETLANVDWLHGGAEALLTTTSLLVVAGFRSDSVTDGPVKEAVKNNENLIKGAAIGLAGLFAAFCALGPGAGVEAHSPFLLGESCVETFACCCRQ